MEKRMLRAMAEAAESLMGSIGWDTRPHALLMMMPDVLPGMEDSVIRVGGGQMMELDQPWPWMQIRSKVAPMMLDERVAILAVSFEHWELSEARMQAVKEVMADMPSEKPGSNLGMAMSLVQEGKHRSELDDRVEGRSVYVMNRSGEVFGVTRIRGTEELRYSDEDRDLPEGMLPMDESLLAAMRFCMDIA